MRSLLNFSYIRTMAELFLSSNLASSMRALLIYPFIELGFFSENIANYSFPIDERDWNAGRLEDPVLDGGCPPHHCLRPRHPCQRDEVRDNTMMRHVLELG